jgi:hypothetical protein
MWYKFNKNKHVIVECDCEMEKEQVEKTNKQFYIVNKKNTFNTSIKKLAEEIVDKLQDKQDYLILELEQED